jgi:hypothetical protein
MSDTFRALAGDDSAPRRVGAQFYETTIITYVAGEAVTVAFGVVPARSIDPGKRGSTLTFEGLISIAGLGSTGDAVSVPDVKAVTTATALMVDPELSRSDKLPPVWTRFAYTVEAPGASRFISPPWWADGEDSALRVAERVVFGLPIPFESSPLSGPTLASIISALGGGAVVVAVFDGIGSPWLLVAVPAGVIVMKVTHAAGGALGAVVRQRILRWLAPDLLENDVQRGSGESN